MNYLVFRLYGPMASWGEIAVGENRHTASYPSKSAITGLLGAALGVRREEVTQQEALANDYSMAVKVVSAGGFLKDYHTAQAPDSVGKFRYRTRRDELIAGKARLGTVLSSREYRTDALAIVALKASLKGDKKPLWSLQQIQQALLQPKFHLYLGRKSCPLAAPLQPELVNENDFLSALNAYQPEPLLIDQPGWVSEENYLKPDSTIHYYWQGELSDFSDAETVAVEQVQQLVRHDQPVSRSRWQFQPRKENLWLQPQTAKGGC